MSNHHRMNGSRPPAGEPMTSEELAMLSAIHADPKNDSPRLAYAAWLAANGQPDAAEFIQIQCQEPYFKLDTGDDTATLSHDTWWANRDDKLRVNRAIELLNRIYGSMRYPKLRRWYWEESLIVEVMKRTSLPLLLRRSQLFLRCPSSG